MIFADRVKERAKQLAGSDKFLGKYPDALKYVVKKLTPEEREEAITLGEQWSSNGPSEEQKMK